MQLLLWIIQDETFLTCIYNSGVEKYFFRKFVEPNQYVSKYRYSVQFKYLLVWNSWDMVYRVQGRRPVWRRPLANPMNNSHAILNSLPNARLFVQSDKILWQSVASWTGILWRSIVEFVPRITYDAL